jgi:hypothetical protein
MAWFEVGDTVRVQMPRALDKRGVMGIHVMFKTSQEARFDGAVGTITDINPIGTHGVPLYLVDFRGHENRIAIPWSVQWFRQEWIQPVEEKPARGREMVRPVETS